MSITIARETKPDVDTFPKGFDPQRHPIIAVHWFGFRSVGAETEKIVARLASIRRATG